MLLEDTATRHKHPRGPPRCCHCLCWLLLLLTRTKATLLPWAGGGGCGCGGTPRAPPSPPAPPSGTVPPPLVAQRPCPARPATSAALTPRSPAMAPRLWRPAPGLREGCRTRERGDSKPSGDTPPSLLFKVHPRTPVMYLTRFTPSLGPSGHRASAGVVSHYLPWDKGWGRVPLTWFCLFPVFILPTHRCSYPMQFLRSKHFLVTTLLTFERPLQSLSIFHKGAHVPHNLAMGNYWVSSQFRRGRALFSVRLHTHTYTDTQ